MVKLEYSMIIEHDQLPRVVDILVTWVIPCSLVPMNKWRCRVIVPIQNAQSLRMIFNKKPSIPA